MSIGHIIGIILLALGAFFFVSEIIGLFRFKFTINRMHAAALGDTLGLLCCIAGTSLLKGFSLATVKLALIPVFVFFTSPVASHLIAKTEVTLHGNRKREYKEITIRNCEERNLSDCEGSFCEYDEANETNETK